MKIKLSIIILVTKLLDAYFCHINFGEKEISIFFNYISLPVTLM